MSSQSLDLIERLSELKEKGMLTEAQFQQKKTTLLSDVSSFDSQSTPKENTGTYWLPVPSMIMGIISFMACLDTSIWDADTLVGVAIFSIVSLILGIVSLSRQKTGKAMAIAGITLSVISLLVINGLTA